MDGCALPVVVALTLSCKKNTGPVFPIGRGRSPVNSGMAPRGAGRMDSHGGVSWGWHWIFLKLNDFFLKFS